MTILSKVLEHHFCKLFIAMPDKNMPHILAQCFWKFTKEWGYIARHALDFICLLRIHACVSTLLFTLPSHSTIPNVCMFCSGKCTVQMKTIMSNSHSFRGKDSLWTSRNSSISSVGKLAPNSCVPGSDRIIRASRIQTCSPLSSGFQFHHDNHSLGTVTFSKEVISPRDDCSTSFGCRRSIDEARELFKKCTISKAWSLRVKGVVVMSGTRQSDTIGSDATGH